MGVSYSSRRKQPARIPTDNVLPAHFFDDSPMVRGIVMRWMVRFDDVLDPVKLHQALNTLLGMKSWRRLGGRLRYNSQGKLEIHVPEEFSAERPAAQFSQISFDMGISDHPLASRLPRPTDGPSIQAGGEMFRDLKAPGRESLPVTLKDYIQSDDPPLELHVFTFKDATIVTLNFPHVLTDAVGLSALIENWCKVLAGRSEEVAPLEGSDLLNTVGLSDKNGEMEEEHVLKQKMLTGLSFVRFGLSFVRDLAFGPTMETRTIFLPEKSVTALKQQAVDDLRQNEPEGTPFISEGDVLSAWGTKMIGRGLGPRCKRTMVVMNVFELRKRLGTVFDSTAAIVQNAFFVLTTILTAREAQDMPLGQIALRLRASLVEQTTEAQVRALVREQRASMQKAGRPVLFAEPDSILLPFSNWNRAGFFDVVDFSPAVLEAGEKSNGQSNAVGKPSFFLAFDANPKPNPTYRNVMNIIGKDHAGNCWITGMLSPDTWTKVDEEFGQGYLKPKSG